jgi:hypothetical protein
MEIITQCRYDCEEIKEAFLKRFGAEMVDANYFANYLRLQKVIV